MTIGHPRLNIFIDKLVGAAIALGKARTGAYTGSGLDGHEANVRQFVDDLKAAIGVIYEGVEEAQDWNDKEFREEKD